MREELASGSVAVRFPTSVPTGRFSSMVLPLRSSVEGGRLGRDAELRGSVPAASSVESGKPSPSSSVSK